MYFYITMIKCIQRIDNLFFYLENHIESLLINENKCHYVYIKGFNNFMYNKAKHKDKNTFYMNCLQPFNGE